VNPKADPWSIEQLCSELSSAVTNLASYHSQMETYCQYYRYSAFYERKAGESTQKLPDNWLKIFADKNIHYTSEMPAFKVAGTPEDRENANIREKILYAVHRASGTPLLQKKWSRDATKKSLAIAETSFDMNKRCAVVKRYDPRYVFWKMSNGNEDRVTAFWAVFPITKQEAKDTYGVVPERDTVSTSIMAKTDPYIGNMDGQTWFTMAIRWDDKYRVAWIGDKMIEEPHEHNMGTIPIDICAPFTSDERNQPGHFYLEDLVPLQAELNDTVLRRSKIVKRMSNPIVWGRNIKEKGFDDVKDALKNAESGVLGLGKDGEVGLLQLSELRMLDNHEAALKSDMQRLSGFAAASFGESVGANTSGDALGMYFTPTQKHIDDQNISWIAFYESINAKILRLYDIFGRTGEEFALDGYSPRSTLMGSSDTGYTMAGAGDYKLKFTREAINGNYITRAIPAPVIPKNEIEEKRFWMDAAKQTVVSRNTAYEKLGLESPEDEKQMLLLEQSEPMLNPDGISNILQNMQQPGLPAPAAPAPALPAPPNLAAGVVNNGA
jgi:hypothetical protein